MHRIDDATAAPGNLFTEAGPGNIPPATRVSDDWLNDVQENICQAIEGAGIALVKGDYTQLLQVIKNFGATTGDGKLTLKSVADSGWIMADDGTIGSAASAATTRAADDTMALFTLLWTNFPDAVAPVSGGRGASAAADWAADKTIQVGTILGRALGVAGAGSGLSARSLGAITGAETHQLTVAEMPVHRHSVTKGADVNGVIGENDIYSSGSGGTTHYTSEEGSDEAHNNMQPTVFFNLMIKL